MDFILATSNYEREALQRVRRQTLGDMDIHFASLEDVIIHKIIAGRPRDWEDIIGMLLKNPGVRSHFIEEILAEFDRGLAGDYRRQFQNLHARLPGQG